MPRPEITRSRTLTLCLLLASGACGSSPLGHPGAAGGHAGATGAAGATGVAGATGLAGATGMAGASVDASADVLDASAHALDAGVEAPYRQPGCPPALDSPRGPCTPGLFCEYRDPGALPNCTARLSCYGVDGQGTWNPTGVTNCVVSNPPYCPTAFTSLPEGADCTPTNDPDCTYDEGICSCDACTRGAGPEERGTWTCQKWASGGDGCPAESPLAGTACAIGDQFCTYGNLGGNYHCASGYWQPITSPLGLRPMRTCPSTMTCGFSQAPAAPGAAAPGASIEARATAAALSKYDALVGRFLRGDVKVYEGNLQAVTVDNSQTGPNAHSVTTQIPNGLALGLLDVRPTVSGDWSLPPASVPAGSQTAVLVVHSVASHLYVVYGQTLDGSTDVTWSGIVASDEPVGGASSNLLFLSCKGCVQPFGKGPTGISLDRALTSGSSSLFTTSQANLGVVAPCALRWPDFTVLDTATGPNEVSVDLGLRGFKEEGDEMVSHDVGAFTDGPIMPRTCVPQTSYSVDLWVKKSDLAAHGVRNFRVTGMLMVCPAT